MGYFEEKKYELESLARVIQKEAENLEKRVLEERRHLDRQRASLLSEKNAINALSKERQIGFPWLARAFEELQKLTDQRIAYELKIKKHPALKASERVKEETIKRREAERHLKIANYIIEYYENIAPFLIDLREEVDLPSQEEQENLR